MAANVGTKDELTVFYLLCFSHPNERMHARIGTFGAFVLCEQLQFFFRAAAMFIFLPENVRGCLSFHFICLFFHQTLRIFSYNNIVMVEYSVASFADFCSHTAGHIFGAPSSKQTSSEHVPEHAPDAQSSLVANQCWLVSGLYGWQGESSLQLLFARPRPSPKHMATMTSCIMHAGGPVLVPAVLSWLMTFASSHCGRLLSPLAVHIAAVLSSCLGNMSPHLSALLSASRGRRNDPVFISYIVFFSDATGRKFSAYHSKVCR